MVDIAARHAVGRLLSAFRVVTGNRWGWLEDQLGAEIVFMMPSKSRIGIRQCPEHRAKQRVYFALSLGAKLSGLYSVLVANRHRVGRKHTGRRTRKYYLESNSLNRSKGLTRYHQLGEIVKTVTKRPNRRLSRPAPHSASCAERA